MAVTILNYPATASLVESPTMFQVNDTTDATTSSSYQLVCDLYHWQGDIVTDKPTTPTYTLNKFPVTDYTGNPGTIFDVSPILNSTMTASLADIYQGTFVQPITSPRWFTAEFYGKYLDTTTQLYVTTSHQSVSGWDNFVALNGYNLWGERTGNAGLTSQTPFSESVVNYPILSTIPTNATQSIIDTDIPYYFSVYNLKDNATQGQTYTARVTSNANPRTVFNIVLNTTSAYTTSSQVVTETMIEPHMFATMSSEGGDIVTIEIEDSLSNSIGSPIAMNIGECSKKYEPVRIVFKNRYGAFDQFEFPLASRKSFTTNVKSYKQNALETPLYSTYDTFKGDALYYTEGSETLTVNTDYIDESFNDFFKGMLVSDEIYLATSKPEDTQFEDGLLATFLPLVLTNNTVQFKTGVNDKLIQYTFEFRFSTPYKLTL